MGGGNPRFPDDGRHSGGDTLPEVNTARRVGDGGRAEHAIFNKMEPTADEADLGRPEHGADSDTGPMDGVKAMSPETGRGRSPVTDQAETTEGFKMSPVASLSESAVSPEMSLGTNVVNVTRDRLETADNMSLGTNLHNVTSDWEIPGDEMSLGTNTVNVPSDSEVTEDHLSLPDLVLNPHKLFEVAECGCHLPKWRGIEWRSQENGHRYMRYIGTGLSKNGNVTKRRKYGKYYTHRAIKLFVENEYGSELQIFEQRQAFGRSKRRAKA